MFETEFCYPPLVYLFSLMDSPSVSCYWHVFVDLPRIHWEYETLLWIFTICGDMVTQ